MAALVLLASNAKAGHDTPEARRAAQWEQARRQGLTRLVRDQLAPAYGLAADDALVASLAGQAEVIGTDRFRHQLGYAGQRPGLLASPHALVCPVLAVSGEHDALCPPEHSRELIDLVQPPMRGEHHMLAGAGHLFPMQQPALVSQHLRRFLISLEHVGP